MHIWGPNVDSNYKPSAYLVRTLFISHGKPNMSMTIDSSADFSMQRKIRDAAKSIGNEMLSVHGLQQPAGAVRFEVLTGATANEMGRREDLLNDVRNLLIDLADFATGVDLNKRVKATIDEIGEEIGV